MTKNMGVSCSTFPPTCSNHSPIASPDFSQVIISFVAQQTKVSRDFDGQVSTTPLAEYFHTKCVEKDMKKLGLPAEAAIVKNPFKKVKGKMAIFNFLR